MAGSSFFALFDDIAALLDDIAVMSKVAAKKTAGVLGDDLALNAQQVAGVQADRELPVVWAVCKGSFLNKLILVPAALAISAFAPWAIKPLLMIGGAFLCYEGVEKLAHKFFHSDAEDKAHHDEQVKAISDPAVDMVAYEKDKIKGAIRTDFILSAEIIVIALSTVENATFAKQVMVLSVIALGMTVGVYGLVAGIVKLDDLGLYLNRKASSIAKAFGRFLLAAAPMLMKFLSVAGTAAMFLVGGSILVHGMKPVHHWIEGIGTQLQTIANVGSALKLVVPSLLEAIVGVIIGAIVLAVVMGGKKVFSRS
jgi:uncharacterized protein